MTCGRGLGLLLALTGAGCGSDANNSAAVSGTTIPAGTPLPEIERTLTELGGSYLITRSEACGSPGNAEPAVIAVMDRDRSLMKRGDDATVIICLDSQQRAMRVVYGPP